MSGQETITSNFANTILPADGKRWNRVAVALCNEERNEESAMRKAINAGSSDGCGSD
jgi:hypothetical protein